MSPLAAMALVVLSGCGKIEIPTEFPTPPPPPAATPVPRISLKPDVELEKKITEIAKEARGKVGVAAVVLETGESISLNADQHFPMQSVYKLPIAMAVMDQVRRGELDLDEKIGVTKDDMVRQGQGSPLRDANPNGGEFTIRELMRLAFVESDGTASDVLIRVAGGANAIQAYLTQIGISDMKVLNTEKELGRDWETQYQNWATPLAAIDLLQWLEKADKNADIGMKETPTPRYSTTVCNCPVPLDHYPDPIVIRILQRLMTDSVPGAKRLKALLPKETVVAHKTGTSGTQNGITVATNDIGLITLPNGNHLAIAVFVSDSPADEKTREAVIAKIAKAAWDKWAEIQSPERKVSKNVIKCANAEPGEQKNLCNATGVRKENADPNFPFEITFTKVDLNEDKNEEYVVWESSWVGTSGGTFWVFAPKGNDFRTLFKTEMTWSPVIKLPTKHNGWHKFLEPRLRIRKDKRVFKDF